MHVRVAALFAAAMACACSATPAIASAHGPVHNRALTIHNSPQTIVAGDPVLIYGRLLGRDAADQSVILWHRINPRNGFTVIGRTRTDAAGRYAFTRQNGIVESNRSWFVTGPARSHSETVHERVSAEVALTASSDSATTRHPVTFSGQVVPAHPGQRVALQVQAGSSDTWRTIKIGRLDASSNYSIPFAWRVAGARNVRTVLPADPRNTRGISAVSTVVVDQTEVAGFSIQSSDSIVANQTPATISGTLLSSGGGPDPGVGVALYARTPGSAGIGHWALAQATTTGADGSYSFTVQSSTNQLYQARTTVAPTRHSAVVFQGVQDVVSIDASAGSVVVGEPLTLTGTVAPGKPGAPAYLERLGRDGSWHVVKSTTLDAASSYAVAWTFGTPGDKQLRIQVLGDSQNVTGASAPAPITVTLPPIASLPDGG